MTAKTAVKVFGKSLIGKTIITQASGEWVSGLAKVVELYPDEEAREIVMQVKQGREEIGVFENEQIQIVINEPRDIDDLRG